MSELKHLPEVNHLARDGYQNCLLSIGYLKTLKNDCLKYVFPFPASKHHLSINN